MSSKPKVHILVDTIEEKQASFPVSMTTLELIPWLAEEARLRQEHLLSPINEIPLKNAGQSLSLAAITDIFHLLKKASKMKITSADLDASVERSLQIVPLFLESFCENWEKKFPDLWKRLQSWEEKTPTELNHLWDAAFALQLYWLSWTITVFKRKKM